jgi:predicted neuraminidase
MPGSDHRNAPGRLRVGTGYSWPCRLELLLTVLFVLFVSGARAAASASLIDRLSDGRIRPSPVSGLSEAYLPIIFPSSHSSNLLSLRNGDLLCAWYSGSWEGHSGVAIVVSRLPRRSEQWTRPAVAAKEEGWALENPVLFEPPAGPLWLFYTRQPANEGQSKSRVFYRTSSDEGYTWTAPKLLFDRAGAFDRQRLLVTGDEWLFPMYYTPSSGITGKDALSHTSAVEISSDQGQTWKECAIPNSNGLVQPDLVEASAGHFLIFLRSRFADWVYISHSEDGCSWSSPELTRIPNNNSSLQIVRLRNGHLVMAFNNMQASPARGRPQLAPRWPLTAALSIDGGKSWPWVRDIDIGQGVPQEPTPAVIAGVDASDLRDSFYSHLFDYEYPSVVEDADGLIYVSYTYRRRTIKCVRFDEEWIKHGSTLGLFTGDPASSK